MSEKRIKISIDPKGNVSTRTLCGFEGTNCHEATDVIMACINGSIKAQGATDDADRIPDSPAFITGLN
jgi:hypothetical protein